MPLELDTLETSFDLVAPHGEALVDVFYARLTELAATGEAGGVDEVTSPDDNLQAVFQYLVK